MADNMTNYFCKICEEDQKSAEAFELHMREHRIAELMPESDSDFIPEAPEPELDPLTGIPKPPRKMYQQRPYSPMTDYGG